MFWICAGNSIDNTGMFLLLLSSTYAESGPFLLLTLPQQRGGWGGTGSQERTWLGQLTPADVTLSVQIWGEKEGRDIWSDGVFLPK